MNNYHKCITIITAFLLLVPFFKKELQAGSGCSRAGNYYTIELPDKWEVISSGG
jgi:hypothetical protein